MRIRTHTSLALAVVLAGALGLVGCGEKKTAQETPTDQMAQSESTGAPTQTESGGQATETPAPSTNEVGTAPTTHHTTATTRHRTHGGGTYGETERTEAAPASSRPAPVIVPAGTELDVTLVDEMSTKTDHVGESFVGHLANDVVIEGQTVFPAGSKVEGHVLASERAGKTAPRARLQLAFDRVIVGGVATDISSTGPVLEGKSSGSGNAKRIGGGAAAGAVVGGILGKGVGGAVKGAVVGAAAGTAASIIMRGSDLEIDAGQKTVVMLDHPVHVGSAALEAAAQR